MSSPVIQGPAAAPLIQGSPPIPGPGPNPSLHHRIPGMAGPSLSPGPVSAERAALSPSLWGVMNPHPTPAVPAAVSAAPVPPAAGHYGGGGGWAVQHDGGGAGFPPVAGGGLAPCGISRLGGPCGPMGS